ncbi:MAG: hypothetical protein ACI9WU_000331 [Myxococcota bacterium]|jgi:hypothetical protein
MKKGILMIVVGLAMIIFDLNMKPVFSIPVTSGFSFPVGILAMIVGGLWVVSSRVAEQEARLTQGEIALWGAQLEKVTPQIISLSEQSLSTEYITEKLAKETEIPQDVLIKYMYAMRNYLQDVQARETRGEGT